ncbi:tumor necrosis factor receptor superfamily member 1A [Clarias gariepinus]
MLPVFMVFALAAASLCHSGNCSNICKEPLPEGQRIFETQCSAGYYRKQYCPNSNKILCELCGEDTYTKVDNTALECSFCRVCGPDEVATRECTNKTNRECACKDGLYRSFAEHSGGICKNCTVCQNCSKCPECKGNCGVQNCKHGQFLDQQGKCQLCANHNCLDKSCNSFCNPVPPTTSDLVSKVILCILILLGLFAFCCLMCEASRRRHLCCRARIKNVNVQNGVPPKVPTLPDQPGDEPDIHLPMNIIPGSEVKGPGNRDKLGHLDTDLAGQITAPLIIHGNIKEPARNEPEKEMWPASMLYTIIRQVPVRRWKEFLRLLSLSDDQMERLELEARGSYLELQYQMLRLWSQMNGACLEIIYSTLHCMDLSGCAEDLQEKLQQLQETMV